MDKQRYPLFINIYKEKENILIVPLTDHIGGYRVELDKYVFTDNLSNYKFIGSSIIDCFNLILNTSISDITPKELEKNAIWKKCSKYKSWNTFLKNNYYSLVRLYEDGHYRIFSAIQSNTIKGTYDKCIKIIELPKEATAEEIGNAVIDVFNALEEYYKEHPSKKIERYPIETIELLDSSSLKFQTPKNSHFVDSDDCGAAEIYKCYSYLANEYAEPSAEFFLGIGAELDCDLSVENIRKSYEEYNGKADFFEINNVDFGIYKLRAEMKNKSVHKISYYLQIDEDEILECSMEVHQPNRRKKVDEKLSALFQDFALSCKRDYTNND